MKDLTTPPKQLLTAGKSILDYTPYELAMIDANQDRNRGYIDNSDEDLENYYYED